MRLFFLLTLQTYLQYNYADQKRRSFCYAASLIFFAMALMSKPMAVTLPLILLILDLYPIKKLTGQKKVKKVLLLNKIPFCLLAFLSSLTTLWAQKAGGALATLNHYPLSARILVAIRAYIFYIIKMVLPINLAPFYPYPATIKELYSTSYIAPIIPLILITIVCFNLRKKSGLYLSLWATYIILLLPVIGIVQVGSQVAADRYTYLPSIAFFLLLGLGVAHIYEKYRYSKNVITILFLSSTVILGIFAHKTINQIAIWKNTMTLWSYEIDLFPDSADLAYSNRGIVYYESNQFEKAIYEYSNALRINPKNALALYNRGNSFKELGKFRQAILDYTQSVNIRPEIKENYEARGYIYEMLGEYPQALLDYNKTIAIDSEMPEIYYKRGNVYSKMEKYQQSIIDFSKAIKHKKKYAIAYNARGISYFMLKNFNKALYDYNEAIKYNNELFEAYYNRGIVHDVLKNFDKAIEDYTMSINQNPDHVKAYNNRGKMYYQLGEFQKAIADFFKSVQINPDYKMGYINLSKVFLRLGDEEKAKKIREQMP